MKIIDRKFLNSTTKTCHASTIAFHKGEPIFSWFGGSREGLPDSSIYIQYKDKVRPLGKNIQIAHWNPILFNVEDELFLAYKRGEFCDRWQTYIRNITDIENFEAFDRLDCQIIPAGLNFAVKTKPVIGKYDKVIYCGSSVETRDDWTSYIEEYEYSDGKFVFKDRSSPLIIDKKVHEYMHPLYGKIKSLTQGIIQPTLWVDDNGTYHAFFRSSRGIGKIYHSHNSLNSWSDEWSDPAPTEFDNPNSGVDVVYISDPIQLNGRLFLVHNPSSELRNPLVISELDRDFKVVDEIVIRDSVEKKDKTLTGELSYPYIVENDGKLHLTYTYGRVKLEYITIEV